MSSLKAFLPILSGFVGLSPDALYERQRALVRLHLLPKPTTRGRNGGVPATPDAVAMMLIAVLATDNLSDMDDRIEMLANRKAIGPFDGKHPGVCPFTRKRNFHEALAA